jgi:hypothetical protein
MRCILLYSLIGLCRIQIGIFLNERRSHRVFNNCISLLLLLLYIGLAGFQSVPVTGQTPFHCSAKNFQTILQLPALEHVV